MGSVCLTLGMLTGKEEETDFLFKIKVTEIAQGYWQWLCKQFGVCSQHPLGCDLFPFPLPLMHTSILHPGCVDVTPGPRESKP